MWPWTGLVAGLGLETSVPCPDARWVGGWNGYCPPVGGDGNGCTGLQRVLKGVFEKCGGALRCHGVMVSMLGPTSRRRQLPVIPAGPEWHNTAASATPCATLRNPPPPPSPHCRCPRHTAWAATGPTTQPGPQAGPCAHRAPNAFSSVKSNKFCMGTHPMPSVLPKVVNSAWAHTQCLPASQKQ